MAEQQAAVDALRGQLSQVAVQAYMGAGTSSSSPMFNSSADVTDSLARDQLARVAMSAGAATTDQFEEAVKQLEAEQQALDDARSAAAAKAEQIKSDKAATDKQTAEYTKARADAEAKLGKLVQEEEERRARESYEKLQRAAEAAAAAQRAAAQQAAAQQQQQQEPVAPAATPPPRRRATAASSPKPAKAQAVAASVPAAATQPIPAASSRAGTAVNAAMSQLGDALRRLPGEPGRRLRLLRAHVVGVGPGRRRPPAPVPGPVRQPPARADRGRPARRPAVLLLADQPRLDVHRWRSAGPCPGHR